MVVARHDWDGITCISKVNIPEIVVQNRYSVVPYFLGVIFSLCAAPILGVFRHKKNVDDASKAWGPRGHAMFPF